MSGFWSHDDEVKLPDHRAGPAGCAPGQQPHDIA